MRVRVCMCIYVGGWATHFLTLVCSGKRVGNAAGAMRFPCSGWLSTDASWGLGFYLSARATRVCMLVCVCVCEWELHSECMSFDVAVTLWPYH